MTSLISTRRNGGIKKRTIGSDMSGGTGHTPIDGQASTILTV